MKGVTDGGSFESHWSNIQRAILSVFVSVLTPLKLLDVQASNLARLITTP